MPAELDILNDVYDATSRSLGQRSNSRRSTGTLHRSAIAAVDKVAAPANPTVADVTTSGSLLANTTYYLGVAAVSHQNGSADIIGVSTVNASVQSQATAADASNTHIIRATIAQVTGADGYLIFCSTDAAPKLVAYITEAARAAGGRLMTVC